MSIDQKPISGFFFRKKPKIKQFWALLERNTFFAYEMLHTSGLLFNEYKKLVPEQHLPFPYLLQTASQAFGLTIFA